MKIHLEYVAMLKVHGPASGGVVDLPPGCTVADLLVQLGISSVHQRAIVAFIDNVRVPHTRILADLDRVYLSLPMGGG